MIGSRKILSALGILFLFSMLCAFSAMGVRSASAAVSSANYTLIRHAPIAAGGRLLSNAFIQGPTLGSHGITGVLTSNSYSMVAGFMPLAGSRNKQPVATGGVFTLNEVLPAQGCFPPRTKTVTP